MPRSGRLVAVEVPPEAAQEGRLVSGSSTSPRNSATPSVSPSAPPVGARHGADGYRKVAAPLTKQY
jgi:hypothetical protein